jgi:DNA-directed RNA polymerase subunit RPC12/RpoP
MKKQKIECIDCFKIICRQCGWIADEAAELQIQKGELTTCPMCGWKPS